MNTHLHLTFAGHCDAAFTFYEAVFGTERVMTMRWSEAPKGIACPEGSEHLVMHTAIRLGGITLMGADALPGHGTPFGGFDISVDDAEEAEVRRLFTALSEGGGVRMPLARRIGRRCSACARTGSACPGWSALPGRKRSPVVGEACRGGIRKNKKASRLSTPSEDRPR